MRRDIRVLIVEEDPFAINWMALLLARDWRTQVISETGDISEAIKQIKKSPERIDLILLDADFVNPQIILKIQGSLKNHKETKILVVGNLPMPDVWKQVSEKPRMVGYILKSEIKYSLAWAVDFATDDQWVITPGVQNISDFEETITPGNILVLDGRHPINNLTNHEAEVARMALIFSMERRELSDELGVSDDWGYGLVSALYKKLGLEEVLSGEVEQTSYLGNHPAVLERMKFITKELQHSKKARDMETLAFHLLTMPEISH